MILRVNRRHHSRDAYLALQAAGRHAASACAYSRDGIVLEPPPTCAPAGLAEGWSACRTKPRNWPPIC
jgi:16S rRNA (cytosine967-C5)-methyltransferase